MEIIRTVNVVVAAIVGMITAIVSWRVLRKYTGMNIPALGMCVGSLTAIGLATHGEGRMSALLIPYEALGICIVIMLFVMPFLKGKKDVKSKESRPKGRPKASLVNDPWEKELRQGGRKAKQYQKKRK